MRKNLTLVVCLGLTMVLYGQDAFEVASIKPHPGIIQYSADPRVQGNRVTGTASTLIDLIEVAYNVRRDQIQGAPGWAESEHYDLEAKAGEAKITTAQMRRMLQTLLATRFQLRIHHETKEVPMYALVVDRKGPKFKESSPDEPLKGGIRGDASGMHMEVTKDTMSNLARRLSSNGAGRPVVDRTGLTGIYSYKLEWTNSPHADFDSAGAQSDLPSLAEALREQLGLRLEPARGASEMILIDAVERPSAN